MNWHITQCVAGKGQVPVHTGAGVGEGVQSTGSYERSRENNLRAGGTS